MPLSTALAFLAATSWCWLVFSFWCAKANPVPIYLGVKPTVLSSAYNPRPVYSEVGHFDAGTHGVYVICLVRKSHVYMIT